VSWDEGAGCRLSGAPDDLRSDLLGIFELGKQSLYTMTWYVMRRKVQRRDFPLLNIVVVVVVDCL